MAAATLHSLCCNFSKEPSEPAYLLKQATIFPSASPKAEISKHQNASLAYKLSSYMESGRTDEALALFQSLKKPDTFLWNVMIRGYTNCVLHQEAVEVYDRMQANGVRPDNFTFPFVIKACASLASFIDGVKIHGRLLKIGLDSDIFICNSLIAMYSKLGLVDYAETLFNKMPVRDLVSWNSMIGGYFSNGEGWKCLSCFLAMQEWFGMKPDEIGILSALEACSLEMSWNKGQEIHCYVVRHGLLLDVKVQTSLLHMYLKCAKVLQAEKLFNTMISHKNIVSWNVLINGYVTNNQPNEAFACMTKMQAEEIDPDVVTMVNLLPSCSLLGSATYGKAIHGVAIRKDLLPHLVLETSLIDMYAKCGKVKYAELLFGWMEEKSLVTWNTMITGYVQNGWNVEALELFIDLYKGPLEPDAFTISSIIPAYSELATLRHGRQIHGCVIKLGYGTSTYILNSITFMYAKCGDLQASRRVFDGMVFRDIVSWNSMIMGYAIHGYGSTALDLFSETQAIGMNPNKSTFVSVLTACSTSGMLNEGWMHFDSMQQKYGIAPQIEHYGCMIDLLGRKGDLERALDFIERMPLVPTAKIWGSLLTASRNSRNIELAEFAAERIFALDHDNCGCYVLLSKMYADAGRWDDVERVRSLMKKEGLQKTTAKTFVELNNKTHSFVNGDKSHTESNTILEVSGILSRKIGETEYDSIASINPVEVAGKKAKSPARHSVRLALCYGLLSSTIGTPILVKKNVRICDDCHHAIKLISKFTGREIIVGDFRIYHHFSNGSCSCGDYW